MNNADLLLQWYDEVWNKGNEAFIDQMMHANVIVHGLDPVGATEGVGNFKLFYKNFRQSFPSTIVEVKSLVHDKEFAVGYCLVTAVTELGKEVVFTGLSVAKFRGDKLIEGWNNFDFLKMYQQLGHIMVSQIQAGPLLKQANPAKQP